VAHKPNVCIAETKIAVCDRMLAKLLDGLTGQADHAPTH
jgi:hypothetical protein